MWILSCDFNTPIIKYVPIETQFFRLFNKFWVEVFLLMSINID